MHMPAEHFGDGEDSAAVGGGLRAVRKMRKMHSKVSSDDEEEALSPQHHLKAVFKAFSGAREDMDGKSFSKLCKDCDLLDEAFTATDVDLVFAKVVKGHRRISFAQFEHLLRLIAEKKGVEHGQFIKNVALSEGPKLNGTLADAVRFHDDKSTYTGRHSQ
jgi:hypothetical protein